MQTNSEAEAITSIYSPSVHWLSSYTSRCCSPALWRGEDAGEEEEVVVVVWGEAGNTGSMLRRMGDVGGKGMVGERNTGHSVIQRVVSPHSAAGRGFTAKKKKKKNREEKKNKRC